MIPLPPGGGRGRGWGRIQIALKSNASSIILAHNHPSGNIQPSEQDIRLTRKNKEAGLILDLQVIDHIILTCEGY